jgi:hypothetical protein
VIVPCTILIVHRASRRMGKYGVTIARPCGDKTIVRELSTDGDLWHFLLDLGYTQGEVAHFLEQLEPKKASIEQTRSIDEFRLIDNGF